MTSVIRAKHDKERSITILQDVLARFMYDGMSNEDLSLVLEHMTWMRRQLTDMNVNCKLETVPELQLTRITLEIAFQPIAPMARQ